MTQRCSHCVKTGKTCTVADPRAEKSPCTSCRRAKTKCSLIPPVSQRNRRNRAESPHSSEAALPLILPGNAPPPDLSSYQALLVLLVALNTDIVNHIASSFASFETELSTLGQRIPPLIARMGQAEREVTTLVNIFSDAPSEGSGRSD